MYLLETFRLVHVLHQAPFCQNLISEECGVKWIVNIPISLCYPPTSFNIPESLVREVSHVYVLHPQDPLLLLLEDESQLCQHAYFSLRLVITGISLVI